MEPRFLPFRWFRRRPRLKVAEARKPRANRSGTFSAVTIAGGAIAFILALFGIGPFTVQALVIDFTRGGSAEIPASVLFPTPSPQEKTVDVYDPPKYTPPPPTHRSSPPPSAPLPEPTDSPEPGDH